MKELGYRLYPWVRKEVRTDKLTLKGIKSAVVIESVERQKMALC